MSYTHSNVNVSQHYAITWEMKACLPQGDKQQRYAIWTPSEKLEARLSNCNLPRRDVYSTCATIQTSELRSFLSCRGQKKT